MLHSLSIAIIVAVLVWTAIISAHPGSESAFRVLSAYDLEVLELTRGCQTQGVQSTSNFETLATVQADCVADSELTEGPYYINHEYLRKDITDGYPGLPFELTINVIDINTCAGIAGAANYIEVWSCNSSGYYAGFTGISPNTGQREGACLDGSSSRECLTDTLTFSRGVQPLDSTTGSATFTTNFPGWYAGRTTHIHIMVWTDAVQKNVDATAGAADDSAASKAGIVIDEGVPRHIGQLFFTDDIAEAVWAADTSYPTDRTTQYIKYANDGIATQAKGTGLVTITQVDPADITKGLLGTVTVYVDAKTTKVSVRSTYEAQTPTDGSSSDDDDSSARAIYTSLIILLSFVIALILA